MFEFIIALILVVGIAGFVVLPFFAPGTIILLLAPLVPLAVVLAMVVYPRIKKFSNGRWGITPEKITSHKIRASLEVTPESLSKSIVERATAIKRAMPDNPSEAQIEMYAIGYRNCVNDMITLTHTANEALREANFIRRLKLRRARHKATDALSAARKVLPPGALRATRQEQQ